MKNYNTLLFSLFLTVSFYGQVYQPIAFPEQVQAKYIMNPLREQEKYYKKLSKSVPKRVALDYSVAQTFGKSNMFTEGEIYLSWPAMEDYVNQILDSILPASLTSKKIRAYIGRSSAINAYCLYDGTMIVNAGLIAEVKSEAALAAIMGHELAHFMKNHLVNRIKNKQKKTKTKTAIEKAFNVQGFSQENELEADIVGFNIAKDANYDLAEIHSNFEMLIREEEYYAKRNKSALANTDSVTVSTKAGKFKFNSLEKMLSSHPDMRDRKDKLIAYIKANSQTKKIKYKIDEDYFSALQAQARLESVGLLFDQNNYQECLERAFIYHLFNPGELTFTYYIAESVRRLCLLDYHLRKQGFLAERLSSDGFKEGEGILRDLKYLVPDPASYSRIKATEFLRSRHFDTYKEAFAYFTKKLVDKNYYEAYLMKALFENNKAKIKDNITRYLASPNVKHKEYAMNYRDSTLAKTIAENTKEIVLIPKVHFYRNEVFNYKYNYGKVSHYFQKTEIVGSEMANEFASTFNSRMPDVKAISLPMATTQNFNTMHKDLSIINRTMLARRDENEGYKVVHYYKELEDEDYVGTLDIFRLDPETWEFFRGNKISALTMATYTRHTDLGGRKMRNTLFFGGFVTGGLSWIFLPFIVTQYKNLEIYSYDNRIGLLLTGNELVKRRLNPNKALRMFKTLGEKKTEYIKDYTSSY